MQHHYRKSLKAVEECVEGAGVCKGKDNEQLVKFTKSLNKKVDNLLKKHKTTRHAVTCSESLLSRV